MTDKDPNTPRDDSDEIRDDETAQSQDSTHSDPLESTVDSISDIVDETKPDRAATSVPDNEPSAKIPEVYEHSRSHDQVVKPFGIELPTQPSDGTDSTQETIDQSRIDETYQPDSSNSLEETADTVELEQSVVDPSDKTIVIAGTGKGPQQTAENLHDKTVEIDGTVDGSDIDATVQIGGAGPNDETFVPGEGSSGLRTPPERLEQRDIGATINPRELSDEDAKLWNTLLSGSSIGGSHRGDSTKVRPAIERTITETNLQIRRREVVTPRQDANAPSDYRLIRLLGKGGMGNVFVAKQASLDRLIAVKVIKPMDEKKQAKLRKQGRLKEVEQDRRHQFLSEAVVTGDLDHPNIVPIHDIAVAGDDTLFYAMKRVVGTPWSKVINEKSRDENIDILLKVADAIGFAHTRSVVHRDIKPENVMLGDFGVVLVMDWGLALAQPDFEKIDSIAHIAGLGGTPAFMAPEMAKGPIEKIGPASDIYLLGATLFMIITGRAPHQADNISQCIKAVVVNEITEVEERHRGELTNIALKAMATEPEDRYPDVQSFQQAIRDYRSHAESISLAAVAGNDLEEAIREQNYTSFSRATYGYEQALSLWRGNKRAIEGLAKTKLSHAQAALENEDIDLGLSILDDGEPTHQELIESLRAAERERDMRQSRLQLFRRLAVAMLAFILVGGSIALYYINLQRENAIAAQLHAEEQEAEAKKQEKKAKEQEAIAIKEWERAETNLVEAERQRAEATRQEGIAKAETKRAEENLVEAKAQRMLAEKNAKKARRQESIADEQRKKADAQRVIAENNEKKARNQEKIAKTQRAKAESEAYFSQIGLVKARIERNEFDDARRILKEIRKTKSSDDELGWEWRWLWHQANQSTSAKKASAPLLDLSLSSDGSKAVAVLQDGSLELLTLNQQGNVQQQKNVRLPTRDGATAAAISKNGQLIAVGKSTGDIELWNAGLSRLQRRMRGHENSVTDIKFTDNNRFFSGSLDRTARIWDVSRGSEIASVWHITPVKEIAVADQVSSTLLAIASSDNSSGRVVVWQVSKTRGRKPKRLGEFQQHNRPVSAVALSEDGRLAASADLQGNVFLWRPSQVSRTDYESSIGDAIRVVSGKKSASKLPDSMTQKFTRLVDPKLTRVSARLVSTQSNPGRTRRAHRDVVEALRFADDGKRLITASDDYTIKLWDAADLSLKKTLRGHGGWVNDARFMPSDSSQVLSVSNDATVRTWDSKSYMDESMLISEPTSKTIATQANKRAEQAQPHEDEIWSARFDPTGDRIVSASRDHTARVLKIDHATMSFKEVARLNSPDDQTSADRLAEGTPFQAMSVVVDRAHGHIFVGSADSTVRIWDLVLGTEIGQMSGTGLNSSMALSKNGRLLVTGSSSKNAKAILWGIDPTGKSPKIIYRLKGHEEAVTAFAISDDGRMIFTGDRSGLGWLWNTATGQKIGAAIEDARGYRINAAAFSPDGTELLMASDDQQLTRINVGTRKRVGRYSHDGFVTQLSLSGDGQKAVTVSELTTETRFVASAQIWNLATGKGRVLHRVESSTNRRKKNERVERKRITSASFGGQSNTVAISHSSGDASPGRVLVYDLTGQTFDRNNVKKFDLPRRIGAAQAVLPLTAEHFVTLNGDAAFLWNLDTMAHEKSYRSHAALTQASFSSDGKYIATGSRSVKIWNASSGEAVGKLENPHRGPVRSVDFSPNRRAYMFATTGDDGWARVWQWKGGSRFEKLAEFALLPSNANDQTRPLPGRCVRFSPDGESLLAAGVGGIAQLWSLRQRTASRRFDVAEVGAFTCADFSDDGKWLVLGSDDKLARLWAIKPNQEQTDPIVFEGHAESVDDVAILQDRSNAIRVLTASRDKSARVWDPQINSEDKRAREIVTLRKHTQGVTAVDSTSNGNLVMTASRDGTVILWPAGNRNNQ